MNFRESALISSKLALLKEKSHCFKIFAALNFLVAVHEKTKSTSPRQITIFTDMLNLFKATPLCFCSEFRKFMAAILFFACFASAEINVNTHDNAEIASFLKSESNKVLLVPDSAVLTLNFQNARDKHGRAGLLFFWGEREVSIVTEYVLLLENSQLLRGSVKADTSWYTGYCGMLECRSMPMPAQQRIDTLKALVQKILAELNGRFQGAFRGGSNRIATDSVPADTTASEP
jgi:hypothetical protein